MPTIMTENAGSQKEFCLISTLFRGTRTEFWLKQGDNIVGRCHSADVKLNTTIASREHCVISVDETYITVKDCQSLNGTYINDVRLAPGESCPVVPQDIIGFGLTAEGHDSVFPVVYQLMNKRKRNAQIEQDEVVRKKRALEVVELSSDDSDDDVCIIEAGSFSPSSSKKVSDSKSNGVKAPNAKKSKGNNELLDESPLSSGLNKTVAESRASTSETSSSKKSDGKLSHSFDLSNGSLSSGHPLDPSCSKLSKPSVEPPLDAKKSPEAFKEKQANRANELHPVSSADSAKDRHLPTSDLSAPPIDEEGFDDGDGDILLMSQLFETKPPPTPMSSSLRSEEIPREEDIVILDSPEYDDLDGEGKQVEKMEEGEKPSSPALSLTQCLLEMDPTNINSPKRDLDGEGKEVAPISRKTLVEILSSKSQDSPAASPKPLPSSERQSDTTKQSELVRVVETLKNRRKESGKSKKVKEICAKAVQPHRSLKRSIDTAKPKPVQAPVKPLVKKTPVPVQSASTSSSFRKSTSRDVQVTFKQPSTEAYRSHAPLSLATITSSCPLVSEICQWQVMEFLNNKTTGEETNVSRAVSALPSKFQSVKQFQEMYKSLLSQELWAELIRDAILQESLNNEILMYDGVVSDLSDPSVLQICQYKFDKTTVTFNCLMVGDKKTLNEDLRLGSVGLIMLKTTNDMTLYPSFAVVTNHPFVTDRPNKTPGYLALKTYLPSSFGRARNTFCSLELTFQYKEKLRQCVQKGCPVFFTYRNLKNVQKHWRIWSVVDQIHSSRLAEIVLDPDQFTPKLIVDAAAKPYSGFPLNAMQREAVLGIDETVRNKKKSISLIHGPPGTGKTSVICSLVLELLHRSRHSSIKGTPKKILLCSSSNAAIDELVSKLMTIRGTLPHEDRFKLTRVGMTDHCEKIVKQMTSDFLAAKEVNKYISSSHGTRSKIDYLLQKEKYLTEKCSSGSMSKLASVRACLKILKNTLGTKLSTCSREFQKLVSEEEIDMISGAEIVATTLASSSTKKMFAAFEGNPAFCCAIVDEASQAIEPETLQPLYHSVKHLVLVGDPLQLPPTTLSSIIRDQGQSLSMFDRLFTAWEQRPMAPLYKLVEQYRMHPEIVSFPSRQFYSNHLVTRYNREPSALKPYTVINHNFKEDADGEMNQREAQYVIKLTELFLKCAELSRLSLGVIVPYRRQCRYVEEQVRLLPQNHSQPKPVFVNTIDSYQGQERDIIILSCVRSDRVGFLSDSHRLNVALTRARQCLVVLGNFEALTKDKIWKELFADASKRKVIVEAQNLQPVDIFSKLFSEPKRNL